MRSRGTGVQRISILMVLFLAVPLLIADAQVSNTGSMRGKVTDVRGALIVGARITVTGPGGPQSSVESDEAGEYVIRDLPPSVYTVRVTHSGFANYERAGITIAAGRSLSIDVVMAVTIEETRVVVQDASELSTDPAASAGAVVLKQADIEALPDNTDDLEAALRALAGPGAGPNGGEIFIDGFSGGRLPPRDTIREIRINQNPFSSEYDRLGLGRIEILTKPGTDAYRGEVEFEFEDESLNSRNPFAPNRAPFQVRTIEGNLAGPIVRDRVSFFFDAEHEQTDNNSIVNALILDPGLNITPFSLAVVTPERETEFSPRFDVRLDENNTLVARYSYEKSKLQNAGLGGFDLPERAFSTEEGEHTIRLTETSVLSSSLINETRFQYLKRSNRAESENDNIPTIRVLDAFTGGGPNIGNAFSTERRIELQNNTSVVRGNHFVKFGLRYRKIQLDNSSPNNFAGTFTFTSIEQYRSTILNEPGAFPTQFSIAGGNPRAHVGQTDLGLFVQDDWRVNPGLTLSFGLRYERQTNISSNADFAPRFAIAFAPGADGSNRPKTVFRGGVGVFYERFGEGLTLQTRRFNGINQQQFIVTDPAILDAIVFTHGGVSNVPPIEALTELSQTTRTTSPTLRSPYTIQAAAGVERQLPFSTTVSASFVHSRTRRLLRSRNINAPNNGVRPIPDGGNIFQYESTARFDQNQLIINARSNFVDGVSIFANYALGEARSDSDGSGTFPANSYDLSNEYGNALIDVRHRFVIGGNFEVPLGIELSPFITFRSGTPFNITTGIDNNDDDLFADRPAFATDLARTCNFGTNENPDLGPCVVSTRFGDFDLQPIPGQTIIPRNYGRGPEFFMVNLRATKEFGFGAKKTGDTSQGSGSRGGGGGRRGGVNDPFGGGSGSSRGGDDDDESPYRIELSVAIRNIFNRTNRGTPVGNLRSQFFGESLSSAGGFGFGGGGGQSAGNRRVEFEIEFSF